MATATTQGPEAEAEADAPVWISATQAAARAGVSERTIHRRVAEGKLRSRRHPLTGRVSIDAADLERALAGEPAAPPAART
jgi:hypothetical protein